MHEARESQDGGGADGVGADGGGAEGAAEQQVADSEANDGRTAHLASLAEQADIRQALHPHA